MRRARRPPRRRRVGVRGDRRRGPRARTRTPTVELLISDCKGDARVARDDLRRPPRRAEPQPRDGRAAAARGAPVGRLRALARRCSPARRTPASSTKSGLILGMGETADEVRGRARRPARRRCRHPHDRPVPAAVGAAPAGRALVDTRRVRRDPRLTPRRSASRTSRPARSCAPATTPAPAVDRHGRRVRRLSRLAAMAERFAAITRRSRRAGGRRSRCSSSRPRRAATTGTSTCSPKGLRHVPRSSTPHRVAYLDLTGSGVETIAHLRENGRITLMACAFTGNPRISRIYGTRHRARARFAPGSTRSRRTFPSCPGRGRSSTSTSTASRRRAATRCRSWTSSATATACIDWARGEGRRRARRVPRRRRTRRASTACPGSARELLADRVARARERMDELGIDVLLLSVGADLPYLTGYEAMPLERLTMLVLPARRATRGSSCPRLEAPRVDAAARPVRDRAVGRDRRPGRARRAARRVAPRRRRDRRPHLGPLRARSPSARCPSATFVRGVDGHRRRSGW